MRYLVLFSLTLGVAAAAQAQVAAPPLAPLTPGTTTANPATLQWGAPSFVGAALADGETEGINNNVKEDEGDFEARLLQGRLVGERFAAGAEYVDGEYNFTSLTPGNRDDEVEVTVVQVGLAGRIGEMLALGIGQENVEYTERDLLAPDELTAEATLPVAGISVQLAESFFVGAAAGTEDADFKTTGNPTVSADRSVLRYGVGYRSALDDGAVHLEYYRDERDPFELPGGDDLDDAETDAFVAEFLWRSILLGYAVSNSTSKNVDNLGVTQDEFDTTETNLTLGWVPMQGLTVIVRSTSEEEEDKLNPGDSDELQYYTAGVAWQF